MSLPYSLTPFIPFCIFSLIHFYYCYTMELYQKGISKVLLMPSLVFAYYCVTKKVNIRIIIIFFLHWWGDIFFLGDNTYYYAVFCFWLGDIINAYEYYKKLLKFNFMSFMLSLIIVCPPVIYFGNFMFVKHVEHFMLYVFYGYITPLSLMVIFSILHCWEKINFTNFFFMIGNMLFIFSDINVIWVSFAERYYLDSLIVMVTYVVAQMSIINWYLINENSIEGILREKVKKII